MYRIEIDHMDMEQIAVSGQCFRIRRQKEEENVWSVIASGDYVEVAQQGNIFLFSCEKEEFDSRWSHYFDLETDYGAVKQAVDPEDSYLTAAVKAGWGVRILRQDLWEMIITFLISQNNNIRRITGSVEAMAEKLGEKRIGTGLKRSSNGEWETTKREYYTFPRAEALAGAGIEGIRDLGLGYRDKYICKMAESAGSADGKRWLKSLEDCEYEEAHASLMAQYGIGRKVADCICLFGLHHVGAFPVDTHVKQILAAYYPKGFPLEQYHGIGGILQQYMFYYKLNS